MAKHPVHSNQRNAKNGTHSLLRRVSSVLSSENKAASLLKLFGIKLDRKSSPASVWNAAFPLASLVVLAVTVLYWGSASFGLSVYLDGDKVATVENAAVYEEANERINNLVTYETAKASDYYIAPNYEITLAENNDLSSVDTVMQSLLQQYKGEIVQAVGLYIDDSLAAVTASEDKLNTMLSDYLRSAATVPNAEVSFGQNVRVVPGLYPANRILTDSMFMQMLYGNVFSFHIAETVEEIYTAEIPFETVYTESADLYEDEEVETAAGVNGVSSNMDRITFIDGVEVSRETVATVVVSEPVSRQVTVGTRVRPDGSVPGEASGSFCWPAPTLFTVTTNYEYRWGSFHAALDIAGPNAHGAPVVASDAGKVVWAGEKYNGYGYYVVIDHGNGYETLYAHCSVLLVNTGDLVAKGQKIALVGSTGDSTGAHLHFEVLLYGQKMNPLHYVSY